MKAFRRFVAVLLAAAVLFSAPAGKAKAEETRKSEIVASGSIGTINWNVTVYLAEEGYIEDTVINISGTGAMPDFRGMDCSNSEYAPWYEAKDEEGYKVCRLVTGINIGEGITYIGKNAFSESSASYINTIREVVIPSTVTGIGSYAFYSQDKLDKVYLPDSLQTIGSGAFSHKTTIVCSSRSAGFQYALNNGLIFDNPLILTDLKISLTLGSGQTTSVKLDRGESITYDLSTNIPGVEPEVHVGNANMLTLDTSAKTVTAAADYTGTAGDYVLSASIYGQTAKCTITLPNVYTVTYYEGFYGDLLKTETYDEWHPLKLTYSPQKEGYQFAGWYKEAQRFVDEKGCFEITLEKTTELTAADGDTDLFSAYRKLITGAKIGKIKAQSYTGGKIQPQVTVKDGDTTLVKDQDYTVSYKKNKAIGKATVIVKGKGGYAGTIKKTFKIIPKKTAIASLKNSAKKTMTVKWKKAASGTGYEIQYGTKKNFSTCKTKTVTKRKTTSLKIRSLKKGKTYYVRVRVYKNVGSKKYYSKWSTVKKVRIKK